MPKEFSPAPEVEAIAQKVIEILKPEVECFDITYIFASENPKKDGQEKAGLMRKIVGINAYLAGHPGGFFCLETGKPAFDAMTAEQQVAYVHHELCHPGVSEDGNLTLIPHDIEEFSEIAKVHGSYTDALVIFGDALRKGDSDSSSRDEIIKNIVDRA